MILWQTGVACPLLFAACSLRVLFAAMAIVPATYPVPATLVNWYPPVMRIGPVRHNYKYQLHFVSGVYRCERCNDWGVMGDRLFLFMNPERPGP